MLVPRDASSLPLARIGSGVRAEAVKSEDSRVGDAPGTKGWFIRRVRERLGLEDTFVNPLRATLRLRRSDVEGWVPDGWIRRVLLNAAQVSLDYYIDVRPPRVAEVSVEPAPSGVRRNLCWRFRNESSRFQRPRRDDRPGAVTMPKQSRVTASRAETDRRHGRSSVYDAVKSAEAATPLEDSLRSVSPREPDPGPRNKEAKSRFAFTRLANTLSSRFEMRT